MIPFGLSSLMTVSMPIARRATKCLVPGASAIYLFNEGSGTTLLDHSGNGNDGTLGAAGAAPTWGTTGLTFDGGDYVDVADDILESGSFSITVVHTPANVTGWKSLITKQTGTGANQYGFNIRMNGTTLSATFNNPTGAEQLLQKPSGVSTSPQAVTLTYEAESGTAVLYAGTTPLVTRASTTYYPATEQTLTIGAYSDSHLIFYAGAMSAIVIYPFAINQQQIAANYAYLKALAGSRGVVLP